MSSAGLGTWRNPPLAYVVAELVISPHYTLANAMPGLQDALRKAYPRTVEAKELVAEGNTATSQPMWVLLSEDQGRGVQLATRAIALHASRYVDSDDFLRRWTEVLEVVGTAKLNAFVERAGLRYVDLIVPTKERVPADYLEQHLQGVTPDGATLVGSMWAAGFQFDGSIVNLRAAAPAPTGHLLPPDFNPLPLQKPKILEDADQLRKNGRPIGFVDTDCLKDIKHVFDAAELRRAYTEMQKLTSRTFKAVLSSVAKGEWV